jgi:hypothetical protein
MIRQENCAPFLFTGACSFKREEYLKKEVLGNRAREVEVWLWYKGVARIGLGEFGCGN